MRVAVIGAGPSGIVTLKYLINAHKPLGTPPVEARLFESESNVGGTFLSRTYENAELVSSRQLTTFSDFRVEDEPDFLSAPRYLQYLREYCDRFALWPYIKCSTTVQSVNKNPGGGYVISYSVKHDSETWECDAVAVCSGLHVKSNIPHIEGVENIPVRFHSSQFKRREQFGVGTTVLILGSGETSSDVAYLAVHSSTKKVILCHRDGFHLAPKTNPEPKLIGMRSRHPSDPPPIPIDVSRASLFDTAYVHPWLRRSMALWVYYDMYIGWILWISWGTVHGLDQWIGEKPPGWSTSQIFFNKTGKISPYINYQWRPESPTTFMQLWRSYLVKTPRVDTQGRHVELAPWPERFEKGGRVTFRNNGRPEYARVKDQVIKPDVVIYCTGYRSDFSFLKGISHETNVRDIWNKEEPAVGFIGFVRPSLGAIPPLAEMQAQLWVLNLLAPEKVAELSAEDEPHYRLIAKKDARIRYGVDHESYVYQLALDMHSAPSFWEILQLSWHEPLSRCWKLPLTWALGANFNAKFRLRGPWKWEGAREIMVTELWETVARRPFFFGHVTLSVVPMLVFGPISLFIYIIELFIKVVKVLRWLRTYVYGLF